MPKRHPDKRQREHERLTKKFQSLATAGPYLKRVLRRRGVILPFYEFYDSYADEYAKVVAQAQREFPSLLGVFEVPDDVYYSTDKSHHPPGLEHIVWTCPGDANGYGLARDGDSNVNGFVDAFHSSTGELKTRIILRQSVPNTKPHREFKCAFKLMALLHEMGHVHDIENRLNFDHTTRQCDMIEAEVYAQLYSFERMAHSNYRTCFEMLTDALNKYVNDTDYRGQVARLTLERMPKYNLVDVISIPLEPVTSDDWQALGPDGRRALGIR